MNQITHPTKHQDGGKQIKGESNNSGQEQLTNRKQRIDQIAEKRTWKVKVLMPLMANGSQ